MWDVGCGVVLAATLPSAVFLGRKHPPSTWLAAAVALAGTGLLVASDGAAPPTVGDAWSVAAAAASAGFILRLETLAKVKEE
jgi:drug/metabolite transporter (DMT)-like permease